MPGLVLVNTLARRRLIWLAAAIGTLSTLLLFVLQGSGKPDGSPRFCGTTAEKACLVPEPPCEAAARIDQNPGNRAVAPNQAVILRSKGAPLPYGFNDAAPLVGQLSASKDIELHEAVGSTVIRFVIDWGEIESEPNHFDFATPDEIYCAAAEQNVEVVLSMTGIPPWAATPGACEAAPCVKPPERAYLPALRRFAELAAIRYPHVVAFEAWNEPNLPAFWPSPDPSRYTELLEAVYDGVKDGSPRTAVLGGVVANSNTDGVPSGSLSLSTFVTQMLEAGGAQHMDGLSVHAYPIGAVGGPDDDFTPQVAEARRILESSDETTDLPLWITETGVTTAAGAFAPQLSEAEQARELGAIYAAAEADPRIQLVAFHTLLDPPPEVLGGPGFGWFAQSDEAAVPKPVACVFRRMSGLSGCPSIPLD